jgi:urease accessory protein
MRAIAVKDASAWSGEPADRVVLDYDGRHRRRMAMKGMHGLAFLLDLPAPAGIRGGDALVLQDGRLIEVIAAPEPLFEIRCSGPKHLARLAWHLGNRHLPAQMMTTSLRIRRDHVIADLAVQLGAEIVEIEAPFDPEGGAFAVSTGDHHHDDEHHHHTHSRDNGHDHGR